jgi:hypothetical protein
MKSLLGLLGLLIGKRFLEMEKLIDILLTQKGHRTP